MAPKPTFLRFTRIAPGLPVTHLELPDAERYHKSREPSALSRPRYVPKRQACTDERFLVLLPPEGFMRSGRPPSNLSHATREFFSDADKSEDSASGRYNGKGYKPLTFPRGLGASPYLRPRCGRDTTFRGFQR